LDSYELISRAFVGWSLKEIRELSHRERENWLQRATLKLGLGDING
jgi:hypothetical protein